LIGVQNPTYGTKPQASDVSYDRIAQSFITACRWDIAKGNLIWMCVTWAKKFVSDIRPARMSASSNELGATVAYLTVYQ
jgi:hypothetical protein